MPKYTVDDYIALVEERIALIDRLSEVFEYEASEEELLEKEKFQALLGFLKDVKNNFSDIMENALKATLEGFTAEKFLESIENKNRINEERQEN
jgi:hypothetical protein